MFPHEMWRVISMLQMHNRIVLLTADIWSLGGLRLCSTEETEVCSIRLKRRGDGGLLPRGIWYVGRMLQDLTMDCERWLRRQMPSRTMKAGVGSQ